MPIYRAELATGYNSQYSVHHEVNKPFVNVIESYVGKCIREYEVNGYSDSDFYMVVWDDELNAPKSVLFATTRGYMSIEFSSRVDATPEVLEKYREWNARVESHVRQQERTEKAKKLRELHSIEVKAAQKNNISIKKLRRYGSIIFIDRYQSCLTLLTSNLRSGFRKSLRDQLVNWLSSDNPAHKSPFSENQWRYL